MNRKFKTTEKNNTNYFLRSMELTKLNVSHYAAPLFFLKLKTELLAALLKKLFKIVFRVTKWDVRRNEFKSLKEFGFYQSIRIGVLDNHSRVYKGALQYTRSSERKSLRSLFLRPISFRSYYCHMSVSVSIHFETIIVALYVADCSEQLVTRRIKTRIPFGG